MTVSRKKRQQGKRDEDSTVPCTVNQVIKGWDVVRQRLQKKNLQLMEDEFCIFLEDVPKLIRKLKPDCYFRGMEHFKSGNTDIFYFVGMTSTITKYSFCDNGRFILHEAIKFPYPMLDIKHLPDVNVVVGLNPENVLVVLSLSRGVTKEICQLDQLFNAKCIVTIPETADVVVGGVGFLKLFSMTGIKEHRTPTVHSQDIQTSLDKDEWVFDIKVDTFDHTLLVLIDSGIMILSYRDWREVYRLTDPGGGTITCCCLDGSNSFLITGSRYGRVKVWSTAIRVVHHQFSGHRDSVLAVACHQKEPVVVTASADGWIYIWRLDTLRKFKQFRLDGEVVTDLEICCHTDPETVGFWCATESTVHFYELAEPYRIFSCMESTVVKLKRLFGHDKFPNRILVATWDGGVWFKNPVTSETVGFMYPIISLKIVERYAYDVIRQRLYIVLPSGGVVVLSCSKVPFRALEQQTSEYSDEAVVSIVDVMLSVGTEDRSFETVAILVGSVNGQIDLLESDNLYMAQPLQAHHGSVQCLHTLSELTADRQHTCATSRVLLSAGSDMCVKVWRLRMLAHEGVGFELVFLNVMQIRCDKLPKYLAAVDDRVAVVFTGDTTTEMYDVGRTALKPTGEFTPTRAQTIGKNQRLTHSPDYDHTDTVTALDKCPILKVFATASMDRTVKIWDDSNTLLRELVFEEPVVDICFVTDIGDLMIARDFVIVFSSPEYYLPYSYLEGMMDKTFVKEKLEPAKKVVESDRAWIDPERVLKTRRQRPTAVSTDFLGKRAPDPTVRLEEWRLSLKQRGSAGQLSTMLVPVKVCRPKKRNKFDVLKDSDHLPGSMPDRQLRPTLSLSVSLGHSQEIASQGSRIQSGSVVRVTSLWDWSGDKKSRSGHPFLPMLSEDSDLPDDSSPESSRYSVCGPSLSTTAADTSVESKLRPTSFVTMPNSHSKETIEELSSSSFVEESWRGEKRDKSSSGPADMIRDIVKFGRMTQARDSMARQDQTAGPIRIDVARVVPAPKRSRKFHDQHQLKSPLLQTMEAEDFPLPAKFDILQLTAGSPTPLDASLSSEEGADEERARTDDMADTSLGAQKLSPQIGSEWKRQSLLESRLQYGLTPSGHRVLLNNIFSAYCRQSGCGPVGPLMKRLHFPSRSPSPSSSLADSEELDWHMGCMKIPQIPNSIITRAKKHRPPPPPTSEQILQSKTMDLVESLYDYRPPIFQKVRVARPEPEEPEAVEVKKGKGKKRRRRRRKRKKYSGWDTLEEFAEIRRALLPVFSTRLFPHVPESQTPMSARSRELSQHLVAPDLFAVLKNRKAQPVSRKGERKTRVIRAGEQQTQLSLSETFSEANVMMHTFMLQCMAEPWFPKGVARKPLPIYSTLLSLLHSMTQVDVLLEICNYIGVLCQEANIPERLKAYTASKIAALCSHTNPRVRAGCVKIMPVVAPLDRPFLRVLVNSLRNENEELRRTTVVTLDRYGIRTKRALTKVISKYQLLPVARPMDERAALSIAERKLKEKARESRDRREREEMKKLYKKLFNAVLIGGYYRMQPQQEMSHVSLLSVIKSKQPKTRTPVFLGDPTADVPLKPFSGAAGSKKETTFELVRGPGSTAVDSGVKDTREGGGQGPELVVDMEDESVPRAPPTSPLSFASDLSISGPSPQAPQDQKSQDQPAPGDREPSPEGVCDSLPQDHPQPAEAEARRPGSRGTARSTAGGGRPATPLRRSRLSMVVDALLAPRVEVPRRSDSRSSLHFISTDESDGELSDSSFVYQLPDRPSLKSESLASCSQRSGKAGHIPATPGHKAAPGKTVPKKSVPKPAGPMQRAGRPSMPKLAVPVQKAGRPRWPPKPPALGCFWAPGEPGLRVHHRTVPSLKSPCGPPPTPADCITTLDGRYGVATTSRQAGRSQYGALCLEWTTRVPTLPITGVSGKLLRLRRQVLRGQVKPCLQQDRVDPPAVKRRGNEDSGSPQTLPFPTSVLIACLPQVTRTPHSVKVEALSSQASIHRIPPLSME